ncbi:hypothetical protein SLS53_004954 [Cytospora paraplurivora]|uniref:Uncharacterized protein n=1 Tax=Cytospora paraplurivora TaxID=2898453 RepID=A0AAN9U7Q9_9PEZI
MFRFHQKPDTYDREHAAASLLADGRTFGLEVGGISWYGWWIRTVQVCNAEDISRAALSSAVEA